MVYPLMFLPVSYAPDHPVGSLKILNKARCTQFLVQPTPQKLLRHVTIMGVEAREGLARFCRKASVIVRLRNEEHESVPGIPGEPSQAFIAG